MGDSPSERTPPRGAADMRPWTGDVPQIEGARPVMLGDEPLVLLPGRALLRPRTGELIVSDVHLGKAAAFRAAGRPLPTGTTRDELARLDALLTTSGARRLTVLGDLVHHELDAAGSTLGTLAAWLAERRSFLPQLVLGNHDRHAHQLLQMLELTLVSAPWLEHGFVYLHAPPPRDDARDLPWLAGHLHPSIVMESRSDRLRVPVFWHQRQRGIVLPAFGRFTGSHDVAALPGDALFAAGETVVVPLPRGESC